MNELKWYQKLLIALLIIVFSPLIIAFLVIAGIYILFQVPKDKKEYKRSPYFTDFKQKFAIYIIYSPEYRFYNSAIHRKLPIQYIKQESNGFEYFIYNGTVFLFPDFEQIDLNEEKTEWQADYDGDWMNFDESYEKLVAKLDTLPSQPVKLLVERGMFPMLNLNDADIPECIFLTWKYEDAFENEDSPLKMIVPQNSKELYNMMLQTPDLCGNFELINNGEKIQWELYDNIIIEIGVDPQDCYLGINKILFGKIESGITHWHPTIFEIYDEVCKIGKCGNILVIRSSWGSSAVLYSGSKDDCPYSPNQKRLFGKFYYLEAV